MVLITPTDLRVLRLLAQQKAHTEIAARVGIESRELERYLTALFSNMGVSNSAEAVTSAWQRGLLPSDVLDIEESEHA